MKLTASGVANCAAIVRSPSFSRSSSSTTTTNRPSRISSIASSTVAKGLSVSGLGCHRHGDRTGSKFSTYFARTSDLEVHVVSRARAPSVVTSSVWGINATSKPSRRRGNGERNAVDGDRPLLHAVAEQLRRCFDPHANPVCCRLDRGNRPGAVDVALHLVASEWISHPERRLDVDAIAERLDARQRLGHDVEREAAGRPLDDRQADTVDRNRVADLGCPRRLDNEASRRRPSKDATVQPPARVR